MAETRSVVNIQISYSLFVPAEIYAYIIPQLIKQEGRFLDFLNYNEKEETDLKKKKCLCSTNL